jgi:hypothetical protein
MRKEKTQNVGEKTVILVARFGGLGEAGEVEG